MIEVWAIIPARGGSKSIPLKNIAPLAGQPLIVYTIQQAKWAKTVNRVIVSTDHDEIAQVARSEGAEVVMRPAEMSQDYSPSEDAIKHALNSVQGAPDTVVMLQCTSPLREPEDIDNMVRMLWDQGYDSALSVTHQHKFLWRDDGNGAWCLSYNPTAHRPMRQQVQDMTENGSIYVFRPEVLSRYGTRLGGRIGTYRMPYWTALEIDEKADLELLEWVLSGKDTEVLPSGA